nr:serine/threonine-protein phosphatase 7 long form like [Quercus suber]
MPDMDPHRAGPFIQDVLTRQDVHRSSLLWDAPLAGEEVPGVLTYRHRDKGLLEGQRIWTSIVPLIHFWVVKGHHLERVLQQFGMKQDIPINVDTSTELHKITLQGKKEKNWAVEHKTHIAKWAAHAIIADASPFHREMSYNDEYMVWFHPRTVRHITRETSYWDTLVESQLRIMEKCKPGSEIYNDYINALRAIEELGWLTLDDAHTAGNTSEPTLRHGWQAGRRQRQRGHQSSQHPISDRYPTSGQRPTSGRRHTPMHDHTMEEASQTADEM